MLHELFISHCINLDAAILVAKDTGERSNSSLAPLFISFDAKGKPQFRTITNSTTEWTNPEETEEVITSGSSRNVSNFGVLMESVRMKSKPCSKSETPWSRNE